MVNDVTTDMKKGEEFAALQRAANHTVAPGTEVSGAQPDHSQNHVIAPQEEGLEDFPPKTKQIGLAQSLAWLASGAALAFGASLLLPNYLTFGLACGTLGGGLVLQLLSHKRRKLVANAEKAEADLRLALAQATSANETKSKFLAMVSHEIRTPLNGVLGMAQLLKDTKLDPAQLDYVRAIDTSGRALLGLIEDLLDSARIEAGQLDLQAAPSDIRQIVEDVADIVASRARAKHVDIGTYISKSVPNSVSLDPARLRQVLLNLAGNAAKFTETGGFAILVEAIGDQLVFKIADTGPGLAQQDQVRIFEEFRQASSGTTRAHEGAGLGLSISSRLVDGMSGESGAGISLESALGVGSVFRFSLPLASKTINENTGNITPPNTHNQRIGLYLKDTPARDAIEQTLRQMGVDVTMEISQSNMFAVIADPQLYGPEHFLSSGAPVFWLGDAGARVEQSSQSNHDAHRWLTWPIRHKTLERLVKEELIEKTIPAEQSPQQNPAPKLSEPNPGKKLSVLVAEDNPINAMLVTALLGKLGHTVIRVDNGLEAVRAIQTGRGPFDLILMDLHMPEMDGIEAIRQIRRWESHEPAKHHPIFVLSADGQQAAQNEALAAGGDGFLLKPLDINNVQSLLNDQMRAA